MPLSVPVLPWSFIPFRGLVNFHRVSDMAYGFYGTRPPRRWTKRDERKNKYVEGMDHNGKKKSTLEGFSVSVRPLSVPVLPLSFFPRKGIAHA